MSIINGTKIVAPVGVEDVRWALGENTLNIGWLCTSNKICKYSRKKPYAFGGPNALTDEVRKNNNYGMVPKFIMLVSYPSSNMGLAPWGQWSLPASDQFKRLSDFDGYIRTAGKFVTAVRIRSTTGEQYTTPIYSDNSPREEGLIGEIDLNNTEGLRFEDFKFNDGQDFGNYYLTLLLLSQDIGGSGAWVAQAEMPIRQYSAGTVRVFMWTTRIDRQSLSTLGSNFVVLGLCPRMPIGEDYTVESFPTSILSLDMWADGFRQMVYNEDTVQAGSGGAGGQPTILIVDFYGRFNYNPPLPFSFSTMSDGMAHLSVGSRYSNLVTWTSIPTGYSLPEAAKLYVDVTLEPVGSGQLYTQTFEVPRESNSGNEIFVIDSCSFTLDTEYLRGRGEISTKVTFRIDIADQTSWIRYRFMNADDTNKPLSVTLDGNTIEL